MRQPLRVGIAGYGVIGRRRHEACQRNPDLRVVAVCDRSFPSRSCVADRVAAYPTPQELLQHELDVLLVCLPNDVAPATTILGLERGLHVFCEKPPGRTVCDIVRVREVEQRCPGQKLQFGFNHRYHSSVRRAQELIQSRELGSVINLLGVYGKSAFIPWPRPQSSESQHEDVRYWRTSRLISGGGILLDQGIHMVDLMLAFTPDPFVEVHSFVGNSFWNHDVEDNAHAIMRTASGVVAMLHSSATLWKHTFSLEVSLTRATLRLSGILSGTKSYGDERLTLIHREDESNGLPTEHVTTYVQDRSWDEELASFVRCIVEDRPVDVGNSAAALASMEVVHRIYQADPSWASRSWSAPDAPAPTQTVPAGRSA